MDPYHVAETRVKLRLLDVNDNDPVFSEDHAHLTLPEDTPPGSLLTTFTALDPDAVSRVFVALGTFGTHQTFSFGSHQTFS